MALSASAGWLDLSKWIRRAALSRRSSERANRSRPSRAATFSRTSAFSCSAIAPAAASTRLQPWRSSPSPNPARLMALAVLGSRTPSNSSRVPHTIPPMPMAADASCPALETPATLAAATAAERAGAPSTWSARTASSTFSRSRKRSEIAALRGDGATKADALLAQARDAGLTQEVTSTWDGAVSALRAVLKTPLASVDVKLPDGGEFSRLSTERAELLQTQRRIRADIDAARAFSKDEKGFSHEAKEQKARLATIGIFEGGEPGHTCPLCAQDLPNENAPPEVAALQGALTDVASRMESVARVEPHIENAISALEGRLQEVQQSLTRNRTQMEAVRSANTAVSEAHADSAKKAHVLGRVSCISRACPTCPTQRTSRGRRNRSAPSASSSKRS